MAKKTARRFVVGQIVPNAHYWILLASSFAVEKERVIDNLKCMQSEHEYRIYELVDVTDELVPVPEAK
jgi:hypothetical protein